VGLTLDELKRRWSLRQIRNCPGRYIVADCPPDMSPEQLLEGKVPVVPHPIPGARDLVLIAVFEGGGLISYKRPDGSFLHTLNDEAGLRRKLEQLKTDAEKGL
jgi:hypothetical protein